MGPLFLEWLIPMWPLCSSVVASGVTPVSGETSSDVAPDPSVVDSGVAPFACVVTSGVVPDLAPDHPSPYYYYFFL